MPSTTQAVESRVDWLTATSLLEHWKNETAAEENALLSERILTHEEVRGSRIRRASLFGFDGLSCGQAFIGKSKTGYLYRISGEAAEEHWRTVFEISTNVSRLDVASTIMRKGDSRDMSYVHEQEARQYVREHNPRLKVTRIDSGPHGRTLNIGSRCSDSYGRIYDKHKESKDERYQDCWRYEVEFKRGLAKQAAALLSISEGDAPGAGDMAAQWFRSRGIGLEQYFRDSSLPSSPGRTAEVQSRLRWLRSGVAGSTRWLIERGMIKDVLLALSIHSDDLAKAGYITDAVMPHERGD